MDFPLQPDRWSGCWDDKITRNIARDQRQNPALAGAGWTVLRFWETDVDQATASVVARIREAIELARGSQTNCSAATTHPSGAEPE
jgi:G:T-mismatch repair DNA endonuclease (very short patch repair protein)